MGTRPDVPRWVRWWMDRLLGEHEALEALADLAELHEHWERQAGRRAADRRYLRELRTYPLRLGARRIGAALARLEPERWGRSAARHVRGLLRTPVLSASIVLTVGLGIGACTAIFAVADVLFLRPLPYPEPERLRWVYTDNPPYRFNFSVADFLALRDQQTTFEGVAAFQTTSRTYVASEGAERISVWSVTPGFFDLLGLVPLAGRTARDEEAEPGAAGTTLVTLDFASTRLGIAGGDPAEALGRVVRLDDVPFEVIGVLPDGLGPLGGRTQVFTTQQLEPPTRRGPFFQRVIGRLADGVDPALAAQELRAINLRIFPIWQSSYQDERATWAAAPLSELLNGGSAPTVILLAGSVSLLLLLATTNAASLLLTRVRARRRELSVRAALGASPSRILAHLLGESTMLAAAGALTGGAVAGGVIALLPTVAGAYLPRLDEVALDGRPLAVVAGLAVATGLFLGLVSALQGRPTGPVEGLRSGGRSATAGREARRPQHLLVTAQVAIAVPLLAGAGLLAISVRNLVGADPGFESGSLVSLRVSLSEGRYPDEEERQRFWWTLEERLASIPGVAAVGVADGRPPVEVYNYNNFDLEDAPAPPGENQPVSAWIAADAAYFETLGIPLLQGRLFTRDDERPDAPGVIVVDERWARRFFPDGSAVGRRLREGGATSGPWTTVVGVVGEVPYAGIGGDTGGTVYAPWTTFQETFVVARARDDPAAIVAPIRDEVRRLDATAPVSDLATGAGLLTASLAEPRHLAVLLSAISLVALGLAVIGLYGITAHAVQSRRADIAVRIALGGTPRRVLVPVVRTTAVLVLGGLLLGALVTPGFTRLLGGILYGVQPGDLRTLAGVLALLAAVSAAACAVPARRALHVDPGTTLREE